MPDEDVHLPLSGNVTQAFFPLTINVGRSGDQETEKDVLSVASYGRQLGRIADALMVLLNHVTLTDLTPQDAKAIADFKCMAHAVAAEKERRRARRSPK